MTASDETPVAPVRERGRKRQMAKRIGAHSLLFCFLFVGVLLVGLYFALGRTVEAPEWVRERIKEQAAQNLEHIQVQFGTLEFKLHNGWQPRVRVANVQVTDLNGLEIVSFNQLEGAFAFEPLLRGKIRPVQLEIAGIVATLNRSAEGNLSLRGGPDLSSPAQEAPSFAALLSELDLVILSRQMSSLKSVDVQALTLRYEDISSGRAWTIDGGRARLDREDDLLTLSADLALLSGTAGIATVEANYTSDLGSPSAEFGVTITDMDAADIAAQSPAFAWLEALRAPISGSMRSGLDEQGKLIPLNATLSIGAGVLQPTDATSPVPFTSAQTYFTYVPQERMLRFDELSVESEWATGRAEGTAWLGGLENGSLEDLVAQLRLSQLALNPAKLYDEPIALTQADADLRLTLDPFRIELGQALLTLDDRSMNARGHLLAEEDGWRFSLDGQSDTLSLTDVTGYWPETMATATRSWIVDNVIEGNLSTIDVALRGGTGTTVSSFISLDYDDAVVRYVKSLPPVTQAAGQISLLDNRLVVAVDEGKVEPPSGGVMDVAGTSFIIPDILVRGGTPSNVELNTKSSVSAVLSLLDMPPLNILSKAGLPTDLAEGTALVEGVLNLPIKRGMKTSDVTYDISGTFLDVESQNLIEGRTLAAPFLVVEADTKEVVVGGPGTLDGVPFEAAWRQEIGTGAPAKVNGTIQVSQNALDTFRITLPPGTVRGSGPADIDITLNRDGPASFTLNSTLAQIGLNMPPLGWSMSQRATGRLSVAGVLGDTPRIDNFTLNAPGLSATGSVRLNQSGGLAEAQFSRVQLANWLDAPVSLIGRGPGAAPSVVVRGGEIDMRRASFGSGGGTGGGQSGPLTLSLNKLQINDTIALTNFAGQFSLNGGLDGRFTAQVNGGPSVEGRVVPQNGRSAIRIQSKDAGGVVAAAGLLQQARGGDMSLTLLPVGAEGTFDGSLRISETRVKKAPVMADLLSAISIVGLLEQLSGDGMLFSKVEADFRLTPSRVVLSKASAVGPSMGISMDGTYGVTEKRLDMRGVISPVYFLNGIGSIFTRRGEGLIGFNYRLRGTADTPAVQVNPLSALTPGFFREIFRAPPPEIPKEENESSGSTPEAFKAEETEPKKERRRFRSSADR
ncbi:MAG: DUF3971 domain-containing protein [Paracoccaceae bacterium]